MNAPEYIKARVIQDASGCWLWTLSVNTWGYGRTWRILGERQAHRISYRAFVGEIPEGMRVLHRCDVRRCCNPDHLFLGTDADNMRDMVAKGRCGDLRGEKAPAAKLTREAVLDIRSRVRRRGSVSAWAKEFNVSRRAIAFVIEGVTWRSS